MPRAEDLPEDVHDLVYRNVVGINAGRFDDDMEEIVRIINRLFGFRARSQLNLPFTHRQNLVLFMHGLGGDAQSTWGKFPAFLLQNPCISAKCDVAYYRFPTSLFRIPFSQRAPKIQELAAGLRSQIENRYADYNAIALV